jgi:hypothetical protein
MVFGNCGVLLEISPAKGYVEMTGIDAETSQDIAEVCSCITFDVCVCVSARAVRWVAKPI